MEVIVTSGAKKQIKKLSKISQVLIIRKLKKLEFQEEIDTEKLKGYKGFFRVRVGDYRIVYQLQSKKIFIILIGHRREVYKILGRLFR